MGSPFPEQIRLWPHQKKPQSLRINALFDTSPCSVRAPNQGLPSLPPFCIIYLTNCCEHATSWPEELSTNESGLRITYSHTQNNASSIIHVPLTNPLSRRTTHTSLHSPPSKSRRERKKARSWFRGRAPLGDRDCEAAAARICQGACMQARERSHPTIKPISQFNSTAKSTRQRGVTCIPLPLLTGSMLRWTFATQ